MEIVGTKRLKEGSQIRPFQESITGYTICVFVETKDQI